MNIGNFLKFKKEYFNLKNISRVILDFWDGHSPLFFAIFSMLVLFSGSYLWYQNIYRSEWTSERKEEYKNLQSREIELKERDFKKVMEEVRRKRKVYDEEFEDSRNIFVPYIDTKKETAANPDKTSSVPPSDPARNFSSDNIANPTFP